MIKSGIAKSERDLLVHSLLHLTKYGKWKHS